MKLFLFLSLFCTQVMAGPIFIGRNIIMMPRVGSLHGKPTWPLFVLLALTVIMCLYFAFDYQYDFNPKFSNFIDRLFKRKKD